MAETALAVEADVRAAGATPATICIARGRVHVGIGEELLEELGRAGVAARKTSRRDFASVLAGGGLGATTVAGTMIAAAAANVRIFATTSRPLETRAEAGFFNLDLLDRLKRSRIEMPSLRDRRDEFEDIALTLLQELTHTLKKDYVRSFEPKAFAALKEHTWPGNLRELRNVLHAAIESTEGDRVQLKDLPNFAEERAEFLSTRAEFQKLFRTLGLVKSDDDSAASDED
jgi:hypothetical protein